MNTGSGVIARILAAITVIGSSVLLGVPPTAGAAPVADSISGTVTDPFGTPLENVDVSITPYEGGASIAWDRTDVSGNYTTGPLPVGDYRVRFQSQDEAFAVQYATNAISWNDAERVTVNGTDLVPSVNAQLSPGGSISGTVTGPSGAPAPDVCVEALWGTNEYPKHVEMRQTDATGYYTLTQLPVGQYRIRFDDCYRSGWSGVTGPSYVSRFYDNTTSLGDARYVTVSGGDSIQNINAQMAQAATIRGKVTDKVGSPLSDICVQAVTDTSVGGSETTEADGTYRIELEHAGEYKVQFVDCGDPKEKPPLPGGAFLGQWWGGGLEPETAKTIGVNTGATANGIDAALATADGTGTVTGRVTNVRGEALSACVALYLPSDTVHFAMTDSNGGYSFTGVPTGTWTIGFLGCGPDDVSPVIPDAGGTGVSYSAVWYDGAPLEIGEDGPDPIAQGARPITVGPGESFTADRCFGCGSVEIKPPVVGTDHILVDFDTTGLTSGNNPPKMNAASSLAYNVECNSRTGRSTSATQDSYPVRVSGFTPGAPYVCAARVLSNSVDVASSRTFEVTVGKASTSTPNGNDNGNGNDSGAGPAPTAPPNDDGTGSTAAATDPSTSSPAGSTPAKLAYTGSNTTAAALIGVLVVLMGIGLSTGSKTTNRTQPRRRATS